MQDIQQTNQVSKEQKNQRIGNKFFKMQADRRQEEVQLFETAIILKANAN